MNQSPYLRHGRYINPHLNSQRRSFWDFLLWRFGYYADAQTLPPMPSNFIYPAGPKPFDRDRPSAVWVGHSTYLIECDGWSCLTDPVWDQHCSPIPIKGLRRRTEVPFPLAALPPLNAVLLSHNHYDHLDEKTVCALAQLYPDLLWILPKGLSPWFRRRHIHRVCELDWWQSIQVDGRTITAVPTQHFSGRTLWDRDKTLWNGYIVDSPKKRFYFVGDTGYNPVDFVNIGKQFGPIDLSLIPIGAYVPRRFMAPVHTSPADAVQIHLDVGSRFSLAMHWKTFKLAEEPLHRPPYDLYLAMKAKNLPFETFLPIDVGTYINW